MLKLLRVLTVILLCSWIYAKQDRGACLNKTRPEGYDFRNPVKIAWNSWTSTQVTSTIASILLDEVIGVKNELVPSSYGSTLWEDLAAGNLHLCLEFWPKTSAQQFDEYVEKKHLITPTGPIGYIGQLGWYIPEYVLKDVPTALTADFSNPEVAAYFNYTLYIGDPDWITAEPDMIKNHNFLLNITTLSGEGEMIHFIMEKYNNREPILFYMWQPHPVTSLLKLARVHFAEADEYPAEILGTMMWPEVNTYSPESEYLSRMITFDDFDISQMLENLYANNKTTYDVACEWVQANEVIWADWVLPSNFKQVGVGLQSSIWALSGLCVGATFFYLISTIKYRKSKVIVASSYVFLISMCAGGLAMFGSVIAIATNTAVGCGLFIWLLPVGFALLFGSLFAKTGRIYLLFSNKSLQLVKYTDRDVGLCVGILLIGECVILTAMTIVQTPKFSFQTEGSAEFSFCLFHFPTGITLLVYNGIVMLFGIVVSILVGRLRLTLYNEAKYIGWAMYNFGFVVIFIMVIFLVPDVIVRFALICACILFLTMISLSVLFIPKIKLLFTYSEDELRQMNEQQLQAVIRSYTKKFASSSDKKSAKSSTKKTRDDTNKSTTTSGGAQGSSFEDEVAILASGVKNMQDQIEELKKENKKLRETTPAEYRSLYEKYFHESMVLKNQVFELQGLLKIQNSQVRPTQNGDADDDSSTS